MFVVFLGRDPSKVSQVLTVNMFDIYMIDPYTGWAKKVSLIIFAITLSTAS